MKFCENAKPESLEASWTFPSSMKDEVNAIRVADALFAEVNKAESAGKLEQAEALAVLAHVSGMGLQTREPGSPFREKAAFADGSRTVNADDITPSHLAILEEALKRSPSIVMQARLYDVLWLKTRPTNKTYAEKAVEIYLALARYIRLSVQKDLLYVVTYLDRAIQISKQIRAPEITRAAIEKEVVECMALSKPEPPNVMRLRFFELLPSTMASTDAAKWIALGQASAAESAKQRNHEKARAYLEVVRIIQKIGKDNSGATASKEQQTDSFVLEAREMQSTGAAPIILQNLYNKAIEACRNTPGRSALAKELLSELIEIQKQIPSGLKEISAPLDLRPAIEKTLTVIQAQDFPNSMKIIALKAQPPKKSELFENAKEQIKNFPLQSLISAIILDEKGKAVAHRPGMGLTPEGQGAAFRAQASQNLLMHVEVKGVVIPWAQREVSNRSDFDEAYIDSLLYPNPFIPKSRQHQFKRGIQAGLRGDWISATAVLVPQVENSLRHIMQMGGHNMTTIDNEGNQKEKDLNAFIYSEELEEFVGEDMQFQLQVILCDKTGVNLRNNLAHGLLTDGMALSGVAPYMWALTMLLCMEFQARYFSSSNRPDLPPSSPHD